MSSHDAGNVTNVETDVSFVVRPVMDDQWSIVAWLWQAYRHDLASIVNGMPYSNGRYQAALLDEFPSADGAGYIAWRPHPKSAEEAPIGFAIIRGLTDARRSIAGFWVSPVLRREGVGTQFAQLILSRHEGPWTIAFQHDNRAAGAFWRNVANLVFGPGRWSEEERPVPGLPTAPPDHFIES